VSNLNRIPRSDKLVIAKSIQKRLTDRRARGAPEPALDAFLGEIDAIARELEAQVTGKLVADAERTALIEKLDAADDHVDTTMRHIFGYLDIEARRRTGPHAGPARALRDAAFPSGLDPVDHHIIDENIYCRAAVEVLRAEEHQATIAAIALPPDWIDAFEAAVAASDAAVIELIKARSERSASVAAAIPDADAAWVDLMVRLRRYVAGRAEKTDTKKQIEGRHLLEPLLSALQKIAIDDTGRASRRSRALPPPPPDTLPDTPPDSRQRGPAAPVPKPAAPA
jgi:hypothetical protein